MITVACINQKGGVGKTTTAVNLAGWFALQGMRALVVDLDCQGHVAESFGGMERGDGLFRLLVQGLPLIEAVQRGRPGLDVITNDHTADAVRAHFAASDFRAYLLSMALEQAEGLYDIVVLDTPPSTDVLHTSALVASDYLIVPAVMDHLALIGVTAVVSSARALGRFPNVTPPALIGVLPTMFERSTKETVEQVNCLARALKSSQRVLPPIPRDVRVREASSFGMLIWEHAPNSPAAIGYEADHRQQVVNSLGRVGGYLHLAEITAATMGVLQRSSVKKIKLEV